MQTKDHAIQNAESWLESIKEMTVKLDNDSTREEAEREIQESVLEVSVRSDWHNVGDKLEAVEYSVLLTTGGPALRITGGLNSHGEPASYRLEYQDWGTPWTEYPLSEQEAEAVQKFIGQFYFGS